MIAIARRLVGDRYFLAAGLGCLLASGYVGRLFLAESLTVLVKGRSAYTHVYCPVCVNSWTYERSKVGIPCPSCENKDILLLPSIGPPQEGQMGPSSKVIVFLVVVAVLLQGLLYFGAVRNQQILAAEGEARRRVLACKCPHCSRKISYALAMSGRRVPCPRCQRALVLPEAMA